MRRYLPAAIGVFIVDAFFCWHHASPDLSRREGATIISGAPEFYRYARIVNVKRIDHLKGSMESTAIGEFAFQYLDAPADAPVIDGHVAFRYQERKWYLTGFSWDGPYGRRVDVYDGPEKHQKKPD